VYCIIGFGCSEKNTNKCLQCKAMTHISERTYFYKKTVFLSVYSPPVWFVTGETMTINDHDHENNDDTLKQKIT